MSKKFVVSVLFPFMVLCNTAKSQVLRDEIKLSNTKFKKGYNYASFASNKKYLAWAEYYTGQIFIYDLAKEKIKKVIKQKGRGAHEYIMVSSLTLTNDNKLIMSDPENIKLLIYDIETGSYDKDVKLNKIRPYRLAVNGNVIFSSSIPSHSKSLYNIFYTRNWKHTSIDMAEFDSNNKMSNAMKVEGYIAVNRAYGVHLTKYYPYLFIIDLQKMQVMKKVVFDKVAVKKPRTTTMRGHKAFLPPDEVKVESKDVAFVPGKNHEILILAHGVGEHRKYKPDKLQVFDLKKEEFLKTLDLGVKATEITVNDDFLFAYSKSKNRIYRYKIVLNK